MTASEIHARMKAEFDRLEARSAEQREWTRLATTILETVMQCQAIVIEKQRGALERARAESDTGEAARLRTEAKDALQAVDGLTALYHRIKTKLT